MAFKNKQPNVVTATKGGQEVLPVDSESNLKLCHRKSNYGLRKALFDVEFAILKLSKLLREVREEQI